MGNYTSLEHLEHLGTEACQGPRCLLCCSLEGKRISMWGWGVGGDGAGSSAQSTNDSSVPRLSSEELLPLTVAP
jgi:hypothetical protein